MRSLIECALSAKAQNAGTSEAFRVGVKNAKDDEPAEIVLYGDIGNPWESADARSVGEFLRNNRGRDVNVRINSMGGLAYDGITIHNALVQHDGTVRTIIEGMAGSAASVIAMAGGPVQMYENAHLFIHRALLIAMGNVDVMDEAKTWLTKVDDAIARTYKAKTGKALDKIHELMRGKVDGTMFTAREAVDMKFADEILSLKDGKARNALGFEANLERMVAQARQSALAQFTADKIVTEKFMEAARAERIRQHRELFVPVE